MISLKLFDYELPSELIAQEPKAQRDQSRLMMVDRGTDSIHHHVFADLPHLLQPGDLLILNDTRVIPARLYGKRASTGGKWEGLYLRSHANGSWELMCQSRGRLQPDEIIHIQGPNGSALNLRLSERKESHWLAVPESSEDTLTLLQRIGHIPLPPYIRKGQASAQDRQWYQTLYAQQSGSVAAPTAGLHFTQKVMDDLDARGIEKAFVTLHVGAGTFQPVKAEDITQHQMHEEWGSLSETTVDAIVRCQEREGRVVSVGTTSARVLETVGATGKLRPWSGPTDLYIYPPFQFQIVQGLITNFHLPRSSLLMLVGALMGIEEMHRAYQIAIEERYRFYSYGDAMLIV